MPLAPPPTVARALACAELCRGLPLEGWDQLLPHARSAGVAARLAFRLQAQGVLDTVPRQVQRHLRAEQVLAAKQLRDVRWEVRCIAEALRPAGITFLLLKGAAYVMGELPAAEGRMFGDVDVLVRKPEIVRAEQALLAAGWTFHQVTPYDDRYYRQHMHQLPPMTHTRRGTTIDVHHTIVPTTARIDLSSAKLFEAAVPLTDGIGMLAPADMVLHSAVHLFNEGSFDRALRDLDDITALIRHYAADPGFGPALAARAKELDLMRPLYYALRWSHRLLDGPLTPALLPPPPVLAGALMDRLLAQVLTPVHPDCRGRGAGFADWLLYVRSHHLRMPLHLLLPHLLRKAYTRWREEPPPPPAPADREST